MNDFQPSDIDISTDQQRIDVALVHEFLTHSYWAKGRSRDFTSRHHGQRTILVPYFDKKIEGVAITLPGEYFKIRASAALRGH